ncbi:MAG: LPXTG cell wall anchor domain-containing protein, partial [Clostridium perfringens]
NQGDIITCNLTNKKIEIVKTGSRFDINSLIPLGILLVAGGIGGLFFTKKRKLS